MPLVYTLEDESLNVDGRLYGVAQTDMNKGGGYLAIRVFLGDDFDRLQEAQNNEETIEVIFEHLSDKTAKIVSLKKETVVEGEITNIQIRWAKPAELIAKKA